MIRHVALFRFADTVTPSAVDAVDAALQSLPEHIDAIVGFVCGRDLSLTDEGWDYAVIADFASTTDYETYAGHPAHVAVVADVIRPLIVDAARVQLEV